VLFHSIRWRIAVSYVALILLAMVGLAVYLSALMRDAHLDDLEAQLTTEAGTIGDALTRMVRWNLSVSTRPTAPALAQGPAWGWLSPSTSSRLTKDASGPKAEKAKSPHST